MRYLLLSSFFLLLPLARGIDPTSPEAERKTFKIAPGFQVDLAASEPNVVDPVAACFDARGRLFVCEMRGYPNGGVGIGNETRGRIRCLEDRDGDGIYETATTFAEGLRFPMGICPWKDGVIVAIAPDILYFPDVNHDGKADSQVVLYTGFDLANIQQMANSLTWGFDNRIHGVAGNVGGTVTCPQTKNFSPLTLKGKGFHFDPNIPGSLRGESGGGQYGLTYDPFGNTFTATNSQHIRQIVYRDVDFSRNPDFPPVPSTIDIPDHGAACRMFRISPFEGWRLERTTRRAGSADAKRFPTQELIPGGYATSTCSPLIYGGGAFPRGYEGNCFVCDPANNLIHRDVLHPSGATFVASRGEEGCEFLASTDISFRPVNLLHAPDGSLLVLDFYREAIETPLSLPEDIKAKMNLESAGRGRIWRVKAIGSNLKKQPTLQERTNAELASLLLDTNTWVRTTARRLLLERDAKETNYDDVFKMAKGTVALPNVLATLHGMKQLTIPQIMATLEDPHWGNRCFGLQLAEEHLATSAPLLKSTLALTADPSPVVRFRLALALAVTPLEQAKPALLALAAKDGADPFAQTAILLAARNAGVDILAATWKTNPQAAAKMLPRVATSLRSPIADTTISALLTPVFALETGPNAHLLAALDGLAGRTRRGEPTLQKRLSDATGALQPIATDLSMRLTTARQWSADLKSPNRLLAIRFLAHDDSPEAMATLANLLQPQEPVDIQVAAIRSLSVKLGLSATNTVLAAWPKLGPASRREAQEMLLGREDRVKALLNALETKTLRLADLDTARLVALKTHSNTGIRTRAENVLKGVINIDRKTIVEDYVKKVSTMGDASKGKAVFLTQCAACHKIGDIGHEVGQNLLAAIPGKSTDDILVAILDPNREVDPRYVSYVATLLDGRIVTGIVTTETPQAIVLRRADGVEDSIRRADLESLRSTGQSLMPEGLEKQISKEQMADLVAYLKAVTKPK